MTTITFEKEISFSRNKFIDENDFFTYFIENSKIQDNKVEFWILDDSEINQSLKEKLNKAKLWKIKFVNI